jgi:hypothetical protein
MVARIGKPLGMVGRDVNDERPINRSGAELMKLIKARRKAEKAEKLANDQSSEDQETPQEISSQP